MASLKTRMWTRGGTVRLIALLALFAGVPLVLLVVLPLQLAVGSLGKQATARVADTATVSSTAIAQRMDTISGLAIGFSSDGDLTATSDIAMSDPNNPTRRALRQLKDLNPSVRSAAMLDASGHARSVEPWVNFQPGRDLSYRDYYKGAVASDAPYVSETFLSTVAPNPQLVAVSLAVRDASTHAVTGVLVITVDVKTIFQSYVDNLRAERGVDLQLVDQSNQIVAAPGANGQLMKVDDSAINAARALMPSAGKQLMNGTHSVVANVAVGNTGWVISMSVPQNEAYHSIATLRGNVYTLAAVLGSVILLAVGLLARSMRARERSELHLRKTEEHTRTIIDTARQAYFAVDKDGLITDWNAQAEAIYGFSRDDVLGKKCVDVLIAPDSRDEVSRLLQNVSTTETGTGAIHTTTALGKDHSELLSVEFTVWATELDGRLQINVFSQDISERVRFEKEQELIVKQQRRLVEELQAADKAKSDFIATISHELRTPLTSIVGYLEMLDEGYGGELTANQTSMLEVIGRNSRRLLSLIEDVLTLSRIESGVFREEVALVDVHDLLDHVMRAMVPSARTKALDVVIDVPQNIGVVEGDMNQLERALLNVVSNAIKFTPENGRVTVHAFMHGDKVMVSVSDTGIGIPVEEQSRLFSRFFRSTNAQDRAIQGTGLGLTIVKSIIERHGGRVSIQSATGAGTTVTIELPSLRSAVPA